MHPCSLIRLVACRCPLPLVAVPFRLSVLYDSVAPAPFGVSPAVPQAEQHQASALALVMQNDDAASSASAPDLQMQMRQHHHSASSASAPDLHLVVVEETDGDPIVVALSFRRFWANVPCVVKRKAHRVNLDGGRVEYAACN